MADSPIDRILAEAGPRGWVLEPEVMRILEHRGIPVPLFYWARSVADALDFARRTGFPLAAKVVSPAIPHKSDVGGVAVNLADEAALVATFERFSRMPAFEGVVVEEMARGLELIVGAKDDPQFGPVILLGMGGTGVEVYGDVTIAMAPLTAADVERMVARLAARALFFGHRGGKPVNMAALVRLLVSFSELVMELEGRFESIDLNPVFCSEDGCLPADGRIMLPAVEKPLFHDTGHRSM